MGIFQFDSGLYICQVSTSLDMAAKAFNLEVIREPSVKPFPETHFVLRGGDVRLPCLATGIPEPTVKWRESGESVLRLDSVAAGVDRVYTCEASNAHGETERTTRVVSVEPARLLTANGSVIEREAGTALTLECEVDVGPKLPSVAMDRRWFKDGEQLEGKRTVEVAWLQRDHAGEYVCVVDTGLEEIRLVQTLEVLYHAPLIDRSAPGKKEVEQINHRNFPFSYALVIHFTDIDGRAIELELQSSERNSVARGNLEILTKKWT